MNSLLEEYGTKRIQDHMTIPTATIWSLLEDVQAFAGDYPSIDDKTVMTITAK